MIAIDCTTVKDQIIDNMYQHSDQDLLNYNDPHTYVIFILSSEIEKIKRKA